MARYYPRHAPLFTATSVIEMDAQAVYDLAVRLLAKRDHSRAELSQRLEAAGAEPELAAAAVARCERERALNDAELAARRARKRLLESHHGPERVREELTHLGLEASVIETALAVILTAHPPQELAAAALHRRFGPSPDDRSAPLPPRERRRRAEYLHRQGFAAEEIRQLLALDE